MFAPCLSHIGSASWRVVKLRASDRHTGARGGARGGNWGYQWFQHGSPHKKISRVTDTIKIMAQIRSSFVGACARVGESRSTCRAMAAVISWLTLSKMYRDCMGFVSYEVSIMLPTVQPLESLIESGKAFSSLIYWANDSNISGNS